MNPATSAFALLLGFYQPVSQSGFETCTYRNWAWGDGPYKLCFYDCEDGQTKVRAVNSTEDCPAVFERKPNMRLNRN